MKLKFMLLLLFVLSGCTPILTPELIRELANDSASFCAKTGISGGGGAAVMGPGAIPAGGWGQADLLICRTNYPGSIVSMSPDGTIHIEHGRAIE